MNIQTSPVPDHFETFRQSSASEAIAGVGSDVYEQAFEVFRRFSSNELKVRQKRLTRAVDELGLYQTTALKELKAKINPWRLDPFPFVISSEEWAKLSQGVVQRALAFNAYAADMYGDQ
ncbi:MAG: circularly permuted type 2 ATP-grasp protein, partial [Verrucomicrobiota bacterium]